MKSLPMGFRFRPTNEELISHYLKLQIEGCHSEVEVIRELDVCKWEPWDLLGSSTIKTDDRERFFFCHRNRKYPNSRRSNRATDACYWKATGKGRIINHGVFSATTNLVLISLIWRLLLWLSNPRRITENSWNQRKPVKLGLHQLSLMKMGKKSTLTFLSICPQCLGILMLRDLV